MSRTNPDTVSMRMMEDATNDGRAKPGRSLQISATGRSVTDFSLSPNPAATAGSSYGGEGNCRLMDEADMDTRVEDDRFHFGRHPRHEPGSFRHGNFHHNAGEDCHVCPTARVGTSRAKTAGGRGGSARHRARNRTDRPPRRMCHEAKGGRRAMETDHGLDEHKRKAHELPASDDLPTGLRADRPDPSTRASATRAHLLVGDRNTLDSKSKCKNPSSPRQEQLAMQKGKKG